jgi:hypothetical protein
MSTPLVNHGYVILQEISFSTWGKGTLLWKRDSEEIWFQRIDGTLILIAPAGGIGPTGPAGPTGPPGPAGPPGPGVATYAATEINTATYSATFTYQYYGVTYTGGICTVTLPLGVPATDDGKFINIADEVGGISYYNRGIIVQGSGGQLINGNTQVLMKLERMSLDFLFRNGEWKTI